MEGRRVDGWRDGGSDGLREGGSTDGGMGERWREGRRVDGGRDGGREGGREKREG